MEERTGLKRTCLHTDKTAPSVEYSRVDHAGDEAKEDQNYVGPVLVDILGQGFPNEGDASSLFENTIGVACHGLSVSQNIIAEVDAWT